MAEEETPKNSKKREDLKGLRYPAEYEEFIIWMALPEFYRVPKTQRELAEKFGVGEDTLSEWKQREGFWEAVERKRKEWGKERTPNVILGLYRKAVRDGNAAEAKLWLQYFEGWAEKVGVKHEIPKSLMDLIANVLESEKK
jgi:hypothetical protein